MLEIRQAEQRDLEALAAIYVENWKAAYAGLLDEGFLEALDAAAMAGKWRTHLAGEKNRLFVACDDGQLLGFGASRPDDEMERTVYLESLHMAPAARGKGIGSRLLQKIGQQAVTEGYDKMTVCIVKGNDGARALYTRLGAVHLKDFTDDFGGATSRSEKLIWTDLRAFQAQEG